MKTLTRIALLCAVLTAFLCASAYASGVQAVGKPTVNGAPIGTYNLSGLEEIAVPVQAAVDAPENVNLFASFYDRNNKYVGMGATPATVDNETSFVIMPVEDAVTGAEVLKMAVTDADFRPLSVSSYSLTGGGGGSGGGISTVTYSYYLKAAASFTSENGGSGAAYVMRTQPTEDTDLSEAFPLSTTFQYQSNGSYFVYYVIFAPYNGSELAYPRIVQGPASGVSRVPVTLKSAPNAIVYRIWTNGSLSETNAPTVTMKGIFRGNAGGGGGGGSSSGGGTITPGGNDNPPVVTKTTYYLLAQAEVISAEHGTVFMTDVQPSASTTAPYYSGSAMRALFNKEFASYEAHNLTGYVVFVPEEGYELDPATVSVTKPVTVNGQDTTENVTHSDPTLVTIANNVSAYWISFTELGNTNSSTDESRTPDVLIRAGFKQTQVTPPTPADEVTWTITPNVIGGFVEISEEAFANDKAQVTADNLTKTTFTLKKGESKTVYVAVSPDTANKYQPGNPNLTRTDNGNALVNPMPTARDENKLFLYSISLTTQNTTAQATRVETVLEGGFEADKTVQYHITVTPKYYNNGAIADPPADVKFNVQADTEEANPNKNVPVYASAMPGYRVREVTVIGKTSGKTFSVTPRTEGVDPLEYVFTMPDEDVEVQVVYEDVPDDRLTYTVNVTFEGEGSMTLNIGGQDEKFEGSRTVTRTMLTSEYVAQYGDQYGGQALPVYMGAAPVPAANYKYDAQNSDWGAFDPESAKENPDQSLTPGGTLNIKVVFVRERSFGYNLTVIGKGSVVVTFNGNDQDEFTNDTDDMATTSHSEFIDGVTTVNVAVAEATPATGWVFDSNVLINEESRALEANYSMSEGMVDIVVTFRKEDAPSGGLDHQNETPVLSGAVEQAE